MIYAIRGNYQTTISKVKDYSSFSNADIEKGLRLDSGSTTEYELEYLKAAIQLAENYIADDIVLTTISLTVKEFSSDSITLLTSHLVSVSGVTINGVTISDYDINKYHSTTDLVFNSYYSGELKITYITGFSSIPFDIKRVIIVKTADLFDIERNGYMMQNYKENNVFEKVLNNYKNYYI